MAGTRTICITGAGGFIGSALTKHLLGCGYSIRSLVRKLPAGEDSRVKYGYWSLGEAVPEELISGADVLIHCAYAKKAAGRASYYDNVSGSDKLLKQAAAAGVKQFIFLSSFSAADDAPSEYGRQKYSIERLFYQYDGLVIRCGLVIGPGGLFYSIAQRVKKGACIPLINGGKQVVQTIFIDDLSLIVERSIEARFTGMLDVAARDCITYREFIRGIADCYRQKAHMISLAYGLLLLMLQTAGRIGLRLPATADNLRGLKAMRARDVSASLDRLGFEPRPTEASLSAFCAGEE
ncbi:MAG: NAD-dependent epimerase/dehydratase family protein [Flavobacteriales bacterium]